MMISNHNYRILLLFFVAFVSFSFHAKPKQKTKTDEQLLIELILHRGLLERNKIQDFDRFKSKKTFYLSRRVLEKSFVEFESQVAYTDYPVDYFPKKIENLKIVALTEKELQERADKKGDFLYLSIADINIMGNRAEISLSSGWKVSKHTKDKAYLSGGGYLLEYVKENGIWKYSKGKMSWIS